MVQKIFICLLCLFPLSLFAQEKPPVQEKEAVIGQMPVPGQKVEGAFNPHDNLKRPTKAAISVDEDASKPATEASKPVADASKSNQARKLPTEALLEPAADPPCTEGNLLATKKPMRSRGVQNVVRLTDNVTSEEGGAWNSNLVSIFAAENAYVIYDLGKIYTLKSLLLQADNNDVYDVSYSADNKTFTPLWEVPRHPQAGMRQRLHQLEIPVQARFLKVEPKEGDNAYSVSEIQAFCNQPKIWPPALEVKQAPKPTAAPNKKDIESKRKIGLALFGLLAFTGIFLAHHRKEKIWQVLTVLGAAGGLLFAASRTAGAAWLTREKDAFIVALIILAIWAAFVFVRKVMGRTIRTVIERGALICIVFASAYTWTNWGVFHGTRAVHLWDTFHYYAGSKYFDELGYHLLYKCFAAAEVEDGYGKDVMKRQMRDLTNNNLLQAKDYLADVSECKAAFSPERWAALKQDMRMFRDLMGEGWWAKMFKDHGFNGTPVWALFGSRITNWNWESLVPPEELVNSPKNLQGKPAAVRAQIRERYNQDKIAFEASLNRLALVDASFYTLIFLLIGWAFGLRTMAFASLIWATGYPWAYFWTGGSFMRVTWLFAGVTGVCLLKKTYRVFGGFFVTLSGLLRIFPCALAGGVTLQILYNAIRKKILLKSHRRIMIGAILAVGILLPISAKITTRGFPVFEEFLGNSLKHTSTPLTNNMGLPTLISYHPDRIARKTRTDKHSDPFHYWKEARQKTIHDRAPLKYGLLASFFVMLLIIGRKVEDWESTALSISLLFGIFEMTCYYYSFMILLAPVALRRLNYVVVTLAMCIATQLCQLNIGWYDEQYTACSLAVFLCLAYIMGDMTYRVIRKKPLSYDEEPSDKADFAELAAEKALDQHLENILTGKPEEVPPVDPTEDFVHVDKAIEEEALKNMEKPSVSELSTANCQVLDQTPSLVTKKN